MKSVNKSALLRDIQDRVKCHLSHVKTVFNNLDELGLQKSDSDTAWSIAECLAHLNTYGRFYLPKIEAALLDSSKPNNPDFKSSWLGRYFINMMDPDKNVKKYKATKKHVPAPTLDANDVVEEFIKQQETILKRGKLKKGRKSATTSL
jgi:hypothetical protein